MTISSLITAVTVGFILGLCARWIVPTGRAIPAWVPIAIAVGAAVLGTVVARFTGVDASTVSPVEVILQVIFSAAAVALVAKTADRRYNGMDRSS